MSRIFGGKDPFNDPFFTTPTGSLFGSGRSSNILRHVDNSKGPVIEELDSDDEHELQENEGVEGADEKKDEYKERAWANLNPHIEHPEDQTDDHSTSRGNKKEIPNRADYNGELTQPQARNVTFQRVTYGGINGTYYTATTTRREGGDGVVLEERKQADKTTGEATHRVSRGIHDKGHSFTRKLGSDGQVDTTQTLHNLHEDELSSFEQAWKGNADRHLARWNNGLDLFKKSGNGGGDLKSLPFRKECSSSGGATFPFREEFNNFGGIGLHRDAQPRSSRGKPKKVVRINIE
ncbi:intercellular signal molecule [Lithospermum erythrorhizon]|uniref:Intercellular signal molecule n=1 Tax=Lithospermum erythrorhizon TaxID=34254 RepID=A0AAV3P245_LITER